MSVFFSLDSYKKGLVTPYTELGHIDVPVLHSLGFDESYEILHWFYCNLSSIKESGDSKEYVLFPITEEEINRLLNDCKKLLERRSEIDKLVDEEVGNNMVCGRSELFGSMAYNAMLRIMQHIPEDLRLDYVSRWNVPYLRDFFWFYWDDVENSIKKLEEFLMLVDWEQEELFLFVG